MDEANKQKLREHLFQIVKESTKDKFQILTILSGLMVALLAIGSSGGLFPINETIKYLATILLLLMITSLQIYYSGTIEVNIEAKKMLNELNGSNEDHTGLEPLESFIFLITGKVRGKIIEKDFFNRLSSQFPAYALLVLWFVVFMLIKEIWF